MKKCYKVQLKVTRHLGDKKQKNKKKKNKHHLLPEKTTQRVCLEQLCKNKCMSRQTFSVFGTTL